MHLSQIKKFERDDGNTRTTLGLTSTMATVNCGLEDLSKTLQGALGTLGNDI